MSARRAITRQRLASASRFFIPTGGVLIMPQRIAVLLVDDDPAQCETMADILSDYDCDVLPCSDPFQAATLGSSTRFDLVLLDLKMGGISGIDLLRQFRSKSHGCIIILTGM